MIKERYMRKLLNYVELDDLHKFKCYCTKHKIKCDKVLNVDGQTFLHLACMFGAERIIR